MLPLPDALAPGPQTTPLVFHNRYARHAGHRWLRILLAETARGLAADAVPGRATAPRSLATGRPGTSG